MRIPFLDKRRRAEESERISAAYPDGAGAAALFSECELLRDQAERVGVVLDDTPESLNALDQLLPRWRDDPEAMPWLGTDAGLYLGTVLVATIAGAHWHRRDDGQPVVVLDSGRELDVVEEGVGWATNGVPELSSVYAEVSVP